ncbi:MAG TPA: hypothetical protein VGB85_12200 [Nannocystis sp.]|jgi:hypothetical protein
MQFRRSLLRLPVLALALSLVHCGGGKEGAVDDPVSAELSYIGLDRAIDRAIDLGFDGFNAADSANIPEQTDAGELTGRMIVNGKVDQGASTNKNMSLNVTLVDDYSDAVLEGEREVVYNGGPALLDLSFKGLPTATFTGSLHGSFAMTGDLAGEVTLDLQLTGETEAGAGDIIVRKPGTIRVIGTASSDYGVFDVDVSL